MTRDDSRRWSRWRPVGGVALALLVASVVPSPLRRRPEFGRFGPDKLLHLLGHAVLSGVLVETLAGDAPPTTAVAGPVVAASTAYSVALGELQRWVPGRAPERADTVAAFLGSVLGVYCWRRRRRARKRRGGE